MDKDRCYHRFPVPGARLKGAAFDAPVVNLSKTGLAILTAYELEPGDSYAAWLETDSDRSWVEGRVVWCAPKAPLSNEEDAVFEVGLSVQTIDRERSAAEDSASQTRETDSVGGRRAVRSAPRVDVSGMRFRTTDLDAEVVNFSSRGLAIRADRALPTGQAHDGRLETQDGTVFLRAMVVWCERREEKQEGTSDSYAAGLTLSDVDQRLDPLAEDLTLTRHEEQAVELPDPDESAVPDYLAPWMGDVAEDEETVETQSASSVSERRLGPAVVVILAAVGVAAALWFFVGLSPEKASVPLGRNPPAATQSEPESVVIPLESAAAAAEEVGGAGAPADPDSNTVVGDPVLGAILARAGVNVRGGPGLDYPIIRRTGENERLPFVSRQGEWFRLQAMEDSWIHEVGVREVQEAIHGASAAGR